MTADTTTAKLLSERHVNDLLVLPATLAMLDDRALHDIAEQIRALWIEAQALAEATPTIETFKAAFRARRHAECVDAEIIARHDAATLRRLAS